MRRDEADSIVNKANSCIHGKFGSQLSYEYMRKNGKINEYRKVFYDIFGIKAPIKFNKEKIWYCINLVVDEYTKSIDADDFERRLNNLKNSFINNQNRKQKG